MKDRALYRLIVVRYLDEYKDKISKIKDSYKKEFEEIEKLIGNTNEVIIMPDDFEFMINSSIDVDGCFDENGDIDITETKLNNQKFDLLLSNSLYNTKKVFIDNDKTKLLSENRIIRAKVNLINILVTEVWEFILKFFPPPEYGFPLEQVIVTIMNDILGNKIEIESAKPKIDSLLYGRYLLLEKENEHLKKILEENNISLENKDLEDSIIKEINRIGLIKIYNRNPMHLIQYNSYAIKKVIETYANDMANTIEVIKDELLRDIQLLKSSYEKMSEYAMLYADKRLNKHMSTEAIINELSIESMTVLESNKPEVYKNALLELSVKGFNSQNVNIAIDSMCNQAGFKELNNDVKKRRITNNQ